MKLIKHFDKENVILEESINELKEQLNHARTINGNLSQQISNFDTEMEEVYQLYEKKIQQYEKKIETFKKTIIS